MQRALHPWSAGADIQTGSRSISRANAMLIGGVAALSASVIAVGPVAQNSAALEIHQAQQRSMQLVAAVTDSPVQVYGDLITNSVNNVGTLLKQYAASPFPILSAIVANQEGYLKRIFDLSPSATAFQTWWNDGTKESAPGKTLLARVQASLSKGDLFGAYENFNRLTLFGFQNTVLPWLNNWLFSSTGKMGIPQQIFQNISNAMGSFFTTGTLIFGAFQGIYAPVSGAAFELSRSLGTVASALGSGNILGAITSLVNTPGIVINSFLNGFDYSDKVNPWAGLLSPKDPNCTGRCAGGGLISQLFITIAKNVANALKTPTATTTSTAAVAAAAAVTETPASVTSINVEPAAQSLTLSVDATAAAAKAAPAASTTTAVAEVAKTETATEVAKTEVAASAEAPAAEAAKEDPKADSKPDDVKPVAKDKGRKGATKSDVKSSTTAAAGTTKTETKTDTKTDTVKVDAPKDKGHKADSSKGTKAGSTKGKAKQDKSSSHAGGQGNSSAAAA